MMAFRTHDDPPEEYVPSKDQPPLIVEALRLEGIFPPHGCVNVSLGRHSDGYPVILYECALIDDEWEKVKRALGAVKREVS